MNEENLESKEMEDDEKGRINVSRLFFLLSLLAMFFLGMFMSIGMRWLIPIPAQVVTADCIKAMSIDELDEYYGSRKLRVVGAEVERVSSNSTFLITDIGNVFFEDDEDIYMVREGEKFTFIGRLVVDTDESYWFNRSEFVSLYKEEEK